MRHMTWDRKSNKQTTVYPFRVKKKSAKNVLGFSRKQPSSNLALEIRMQFHAVCQQAFTYRHDTYGMKMETCNTCVILCIIKSQAPNVQTHQVYSIFMESNSCHIYLQNKVLQMKISRGMPADRFLLFAIIKTCTFA